ncbi:MAG: transcriptional regulator [Acidobacteria bacterium]|nr:transcriptional regulator [Acidobacteriota bacterium]
MSAFDAARRAALMHELLGVLLGRPTDLLPFDEVRQRLRLRHVVDRGTREVPLDRIVGSLGRPREFTRAFLPREESLRARWEEVRSLAEGPGGFPTVELYQVGDAYFVVDGHHRVSVARDLGQPTVEAHVREFLTPVPLAATDSAADVLCKAALADFLAAARIEPAAAEEFRVTEPGGYGRMLEHIEVHGYFRGQELRRSLQWGEAVASWRETVFRPMVQIIRDSGILADFPGRTEADLYLFTIDHLHHLRQRYGDQSVAPVRAVQHFRLRERARRGWAARIGGWWRNRGGRFSTG